MSPPLRMTVHTQVVLAALLADPGTEVYGLQIADRTGLLPGTTYPILARLQRAGWVVSRWEDGDPHAQQRPGRRYYHLTPDGATAARDALTRSTHRMQGTAGSPPGNTLSSTGFDGDFVLTRRRPAER